jgi:hypothetical protein
MWVRNYCPKPKNQDFKLRIFLADFFNSSKNAHFGFPVKRLSANPLKLISLLVLPDFIMSFVIGRTIR